MALTVRLPARVEQLLAEYCVKRRISKSDAVKQALDELLNPPVDAVEPVHPFVGSDKGDGSDVSGNIKASLRARFRKRPR